MSNTTASNTDNLEALAAEILATNDRLVAAFNGEEMPPELAKGPQLVAILKRAAVSLQEANETLAKSAE